MPPFGARTMAEVCLNAIRTTGIFAVRAVCLNGFAVRGFLCVYNQTGNYNYASAIVCIFFFFTFYDKHVDCIVRRSADSATCRLHAVKIRSYKFGTCYTHYI